MCQAPVPHMLFRVKGPWKVPPLKITEDDRWISLATFLFEKGRAPTGGRLAPEHSSTGNATAFGRQRERGGIPTIDMTNVIVVKLNIV